VDHHPRSRWRSLPAIAFFAALFFLSIDAMSGGMKASFKHSVKHYLETNAAQFNDLVSFVMGVVGTSLVQSSSTVTSMAVVMTQDGIIPLLISIGIVHGANLGTSVTSTLVAFAAESKPLTGHPLRDLKTLLFAKRRAGFHRAVSTAVVHDFFNIIMVTSILLLLEIPFNLIHSASVASAGVLTGTLAGGESVMETLSWLSPKTYTKPVIKGLLSAGVPGGALVLAGFATLFLALKGFSNTMQRTIMTGQEDADFSTLGDRLLGTHPADTFVRGLLLTIMVQSSSATTSMVVPLAAMGFFRIGQIFPFILGANIGTTTTALIVASSAVGEPGFAAGMTIALSHFYLNALAVALVVVVPGLKTSILGSTRWFADTAERLPAALPLYLLAITVALPATVYFLPYAAAMVTLVCLVLVMIIGPHIYLRTHELEIERAPIAKAA